MSISSLVLVILIFVHGGKIQICRHNQLLWKLEVFTSLYCKKSGASSTKKQELQEGAGESAQPVPEDNDPESGLADSDNSQSKAECSKETASERKMVTVTPTKYHEEESSISNRLVELSSLMSTFQELHNCKRGKLVYNDEQAKRYGNSSLIHIECTKCKKKVYLQTSPNSGGQWRAKNADINRCMVYSACEVGVGREAMSVMCDVLNMPPPCQPSS